MLQDIHPHRLDLAYPPRAAQDEDYLIVLDGGVVLLAESAAGQEIPLVRSFPAVDRAGLIYLFSLDGRSFFFCPETPAAPTGHAFTDMGIFREYAPGHLAFAGATACHLGQWYAANRFCGKCGRKMGLKPDERAVVCPGCGFISYPRISPAVIVGIIDGDRIVMTRYANRPGSTFGALIAGFVDPGEMFEDAVAREVMEEVGLRVKNIRYCLSQPWAFSGSILAGFFADLDGTPEITMDAGELQEARWVARAEIQPAESPMSMTATMVQMFRRGEA